MIEAANNLKRWYPSTRLHDATSLKTAILTFAAVKTWNPTTLWCILGKYVMRMRTNGNGSGVNPVLVFDVTDMEPCSWYQAVSILVHSLTWVFGFIMTADWRRCSFTWIFLIQPVMSGHTAGHLQLHSEIINEIAIWRVSSHRIWDVSKTYIKMLTCMHLITIWGVFLVIFYF